MTRMLPKKTKYTSAARISTRVMYVLSAFAALIFCAFYLIGYDTPYEKDASFNAPLLTDAILTLIYIIVSGVALLTVYSTVCHIRKNGRSSERSNNIPSTKIIWANIALTSVCMISTFIAGSSEPFTVNGTKYDNILWLKIADMFINTATLLILVAIGSVMFGLSGYNRKIKLKTSDPNKAKH